MSIASELSALNGYILGAYDEISDKGGTVPANKNIANLASAISSISSGTPTTITPLEVTENGTYTAPTGTAYSPVTVNVSGGGDYTIADYHVISGTITPTETTGSVSVMTYNDFMTAVGGTMPSKVALGIFDVNAAYGMTGFAYKFGFYRSNSSPHYGNGGDITRGSMNSSVSIDATNGVLVAGYISNNAGKFQSGHTYGWFILWKN